MKRNYLKIFAFLLFFCISNSVVCQIGWVQKAPFTGLARDYDAGFTIGHYGFIGCGYNGSIHFNDFYKWDQTTNIWSPIASYPGSGYYYSPISFTIEGKGYVGLGWIATDLWRYDTTTNSWTQMASLPGYGRYDAGCFVIGHKAYVVGGSRGGPPYLNEVWVYDAHQNTWKQLNNSPAGNRDGGAAFAIGEHGYYVGGCCSVSPAGYKYDTTTDTWTSIPNIPNYNPGVTGDARTWTLGSKAYVFNGHDGTIFHTFTQGWVYDTVTNDWCEFTDMGKLQRSYCVALVINNKLYMGTGVDSIGGYHTDYWQYDPRSYFTVSDTSSFCNGDSAHFKGFSTFDSTGAVTWSWSFPGARPSSSALQNPVVYYPTSGTYTVTLIVDACGGDDTVSRTITIVSNSNVHATTNVIQNERCHVSCIGIATAAGSGGNSPYTYFWNPVGGTNATAINLCTGTYTVNVTDVTGCTGTATVTITEPPAITATTTFTNIRCTGGTCNATCSASLGTSPYAYLWNPSSQTNATATGLMAGTYMISISDTNGCTGTTNVTITQPALVMASIGVPAYPLCNGGAGSATATGRGGTPNYTYTWSPLGGTNAMATGLTIGTYTVTVKDSNGCSASASIIITQPTIVTGNAKVRIYPLCNGGVGSAIANGIGGTPKYTYVWVPSGGNNAIGTGLTAGTYTVIITDTNGCTGTTSVTITQPAVLTASINSVIHSSCNLPNGAATVSVSGGTGPYAYLWSPVGQTKAQATGLGVGTYTVIVTDRNNCTASTTATITQPTLVTAAITATTNISCYNGNNGAATVKANGGTTPYTYLWTPSNYSTASPTNLFALTYTVTVTDANGCTVTETATLTQPAQLAVTISEPKIICKDSTGNIYGTPTGGTGPYTYAWSGGVTSTTSTATITPIATRDFSVTVTDINGCTATGAIVLKYGPDLFVAVTGKNSACAGYTTTICASVTGGQGGNFYLWSPSNNTNDCITVSPGLFSTYTLQVVDGCGATSTASTTLYTDPSPVVNMSANIYQGCVPLCIQFYNATTLSQGGVRQYVWNFGNGDTVHSINPIYCYPTNGIYNVSLTVTSDSGCSATLDKVNMITAYPNPHAAFILSPQPVTILTPTIQFQDKSMDPSGIINRIWSFGDKTDSTSTLENPSHTYKDTGNYCANLIVMNSHGCTDTVTNCLIIEPDYSLYIPSAFTPNSDGLNDVFQPVGKYIKNFEMYIFDRWGMQLYHTTDMTKGWDGTVNGGNTISQEDVYVYKVLVTDAEGVQHSYIGNVTLIK